MGFDENGFDSMFMRPKNPKNKTYNIAPKTSYFEFLMHQERQLHRTCYYFPHHKLIANLLITELPYRILEEEGEQVFKEFIKAELHNIQHMSFF